MARSNYSAWFLGAVACVLAAFAFFNFWADGYMLRHRAGASLQTVSGFERVLKPAWFASLSPNVVFVGSSRVRAGFDPTLLDRALGIRSFNYGVSSISAYETRRFVQDAAARPSVKVILVALDAFASEGAVAQTGQGFDEMRLAVTADGTPTRSRRFWLTATRYLSGGALGMHALGLWLLLHLSSSQSAADRPDLFDAYRRMSPAILAADLRRRHGRVVQMSPYDHAQLRATLAAVCRRQLRLILFFPPDHAAMIARYEANDGNALHAIKAIVVADAIRHNLACAGKVAVFDFLRPSVITTAPFVAGANDNYSDLVHFRPAVGLRLLRVMLDRAHAGADVALAHDLVPE